jgi:hypothetical protein
MGELSASLAHEVNQPIAGAVTNANANACAGWQAIPRIWGRRARPPPES